MRNTLFQYTPDLIFNKADNPMILYDSVLSILWTLFKKMSHQDVSGISIKCEYLHWDLYDNRYLRVEKHITIWADLQMKKGKNILPLPELLLKLDSSRYLFREMSLKCPSSSKLAPDKSQEKFTFSQKPYVNKSCNIPNKFRLCETNHRSEFRSLALLPPPQLRILSTASGSHPRAIYQKHPGWSLLWRCTVRSEIII